MENLWLFEPEPPEFRTKLAEKLRRAASRGIYFGGSSWKYEGWMGQIYTPERYTTRGKISHRRFEENCLAEYSEVFPVVCGDFSFYQFPSPQYWQKLFGSCPGNLRFAFKAPEEITAAVWPSHARYGDKGGSGNEAFLDAAMFERLFLDSLAPYRERVAVLIFEFGAMSKSVFPGYEAFVEALDQFLGALPADWRYAVEIRNPEFLTPEYLACLRRHNVSHVLNAWTRMPELGTQMELPGAFSSDIVVTRALLRFGRNYEDAVRRFQPYTEAKDPNPAVRRSLAEIARKAAREGRRAFLFVNNRLEGNAPSTIDAVLDEFLE
ncbi:MAG: DUF72 domain-containing protein [Bryobacteraceae bacterium]